MIAVQSDHHIQCLNMNNDMNMSIIKSGKIRELSSRTISKDETFELVDDPESYIREQQDDQANVILYFDCEKEAEIIDEELCDTEYCDQMKELPEMLNKTMRFIKFL